ncbi:cAMP-dependent protein kinase [Chloropicon primus]|uniref:cAMP-dependent protein kinase n=1 Tax=Chloropicon primus TaxID=1764295 RepID=A0A5B8MTL1_9CHLO|nr:cAMP-dependent protein kinase [Chloropicon primus]UPR01976.1 cAMP-dependent protein kinase [Chloropicon primus]|eukprot:QDZ22752.1 cAMP-dependent protein kinase [Chloropicon primus]
MASVVDEIETYVKDKELDSIFKQILVQCFKDRPSDPVKFLIDYIFDKYPEVISAKLGHAYASHTPESDVYISVQHQDSSHNVYLNETLSIGSLFELLASNLAQDRPEKPLSYIESCLRSLDEEQPDEEEDHGMESDDEIEGEENESVSEMESFPQAQMMHRPSLRNRRISVSAECTSVRDKPEEALNRIIHFKTEEAKQKIRSAVKDNFLFSDLEESLMSYLVDAAIEITHEPGHVIIKQGDEGDNFYILHEGECEFFVSGTSKGTGGPGTSFGELALMYNSPRAATVVASTGVKLFALDRITFRQIMADATSKKRRLHEQFLEKVPLFSGMLPTERAKIADVLETVRFKAGDTIIHQGENGDKFFILEEGKVTAKVFTQSGSNIDLKDYGPGDYFGELALLNDKPRAASIVSMTDSLCVSMDAQSFKRLLGRCENIMRRNMEVYEQVMRDLLSG